jgi:gliding motility-associated protein GldM
MAGGKLSARQKMINLMYLVFIAMIAMTMTKEVLSAFGSMNAKFVNTNALTDQSNETLLKGLNQKAGEKVEFKIPAQKAQRIKTISDNFDKYIETLKQDIVEGGGYEREENGDLPFEEMDKGDYLDEKWFTGDRLTVEGEEVMATIRKYKSDIKAVLGEDQTYTTAIANFEKRFDLSDVKPKEGDKLTYLDYNFKGFPAIASYAKLTAMQNDVKTTEANLYNLFLGNSLDEAITLKNYTAIVRPKKNAFFAGEEFQGEVLLGKYANVTPVKLNVNGKDVSLSREEGTLDSVGNAQIKFRTGNVGEHEVKGTFTFIEKGEELPIEFTGNYVVVPRPNSSTISADKMNVVYRGVDNPMTISFAGVPDNKVRATAPGLKQIKGGSYNMKPQTGTEVTINVSATLDDGQVSSDKKTFRIKEIPSPTGYFRGLSGAQKMSKSGVEKGTIKADFEDFDFDFPLRVTQFDFKVPGQPTITVRGDKLDSKAKNALRRAKRGQTVQIINIKAKPVNPGPLIKKVSPVIIEITN